MKFEYTTLNKKCLKANLLDAKWLFSFVPWVNHSNEVVDFNIEEDAILYYIEHGKDDISKLEFNHVVVSALHSFAGNTYTFTFKMDDKSVLQLNDSDSFAFDKETVVNRVLTQKKYHIVSMQNQLKRAKEEFEILETNLTEKL